MTAFQILPPHHSHNINLIDTDIGSNQVVELVLEVFVEQESTENKKALLRNQI